MGRVLAAIRRRRLLCIVLLVLGVAVALLGRPLLHVLRTASSDIDELTEVPEGSVSDASRLNRTAVLEVRHAPSEPDAAEEEIRALLAEARERGWRISIAGARHSMGGHTIYPGGVVLDMTPLRAMSFDAEGEVLHVEAGALWKDVIAYLDPLGYSVAVMQSNHSFTVGGSISVNCHGWQHGRPPIASTVRSFRLMLADGTVVRCSREERPELFSLALGGYGLFGVILDVELEVVPNRRYTGVRSVIDADRALEEYERLLAEHPGAEMVFARMDVAADDLLDQVILYLFEEDAGGGPVPPLVEPGAVGIRRSIFRGSEGSEYGKRLRWDAETKLQSVLSPEVCSRNQLLSEGVEVFENRSDETTDILHEYFIPRAGVAEFIVALREIIPRHGADLLNVTVRSVEEDPDTFLRYADGPMIAFVILFTQPRTDAGDVRMRSMTREIIDAALALDGRYYLPYRLHATREQFERAYPMAREFFEMKRRYDPEEIFQNQFSLRYGE